MQLPSVGRASMNPPRLLSAPCGPIKDYTPIRAVTQLGRVRVAHSSMPMKYDSAFVDRIKARPGRIQYATQAMGGAQHLATDALRSSRNPDCRRCTIPSGRW